MKNMEIYDRLKSVPGEFLKTIQAGRLKGMSDIKPQWRIAKLTEVFGPCGIGWKVQNLKYSYETVGQETVCNCYLELLFKHNGEWSEPIPASGGSKLATMERNGLYISDEAEKMAYTDAISVASKMIGLASDVYMGYGGKYENGQQNHPTQNKPQNQNEPTAWLNVMDKDKNFTREWQRIVAKKQAGEVIDVKEIRKFYKVSKEVEQKINELINS